MKRERKQIVQEIETLISRLEYDDNLRASHIIGMLQEIVLEVLLDIRDLLLEKNRV